MSNGRNQRSGKSNNQRRRRGRNPRDNQQYQSAPRGPVMTALGESTYEAVFDHGNEGYGVWFDGVVREDPVYRQHWKGNRPIFVKLEKDHILITRELPGSGDDSDDEDVTEVEAPDPGNDAREPEPTAESAAAVEPAEAPVDPADAEAGAADSDVTYSPEEAARLFVAGTAESDATDSGAEPDAEVQKKPAPRRRRAPRKTTSTDSE